MRFIHIPEDERFRSPRGAAATGTSLFLSLIIEGAPEGCFPVLTLTRKFRDEECSGSYYPKTASPNEENGAICYRFEPGPAAFSKPGTYYYDFSAGDESSGTAGRITVYEPGVTVPEWFKDGVIYQIFPDRFAYAADPDVVPKPDAYMYPSFDIHPHYTKNDGGEVTKWDFFGGNLSGISSKIDHIRGLGADIIYLNPVFESVSNHRYDTADYEHIDGLLGGDAAFSRFTEKISENGIRLILDGVFSHTGRRSRYFEAAKRGEKPYCDWYDFREDGSYDCWWDVLDLPCVKELEPTYLDYTVKGKDSIVRRWLRAGASGWRLDVADELPDEYLEALFSAVKEEKPDAVIFGEVWEDGTDKVSYGIHRSYFTVPELHSQTNYPFRKRLLEFFEGNVNAGDISSAFFSDSVNYPPEVYYSLVNMTGSHDVERLFTHLKQITRGDERLARGLVKAYSLIQFCFPGVPLIYYGDEICMEGGTDPDNRRFFDWNSSNFDMAGWFSDLSAIRSSHEELRSGSISFIDAGENVFAFRRYFPEKSDRSRELYRLDRADPVKVDLRPLDSPKGLLCASDRFGRGPEFILKALENYIESGYNILKQADGYAILLELY